MKLIALFTLLGCTFAAASLQAQTTGFLQTGAGPYDYNTPGNWVGGTINGIWDPTLTLLATQTATFATNTSLTTGLNFGYTGNFDLSLTSDGVADRTITLGGDIIAQPVSNRIINIGSATANSGLNVNLGGNRTFTVATGKTLNFFNGISGGDITIMGGSSTAVGGTVRFTRDTANAAGSNITLRQNTTLQVDSTSASMAGATRAQSLTIQSGGKLLLKGNNTVNTVETISGALNVDGGDTRPRNANNGNPSITLDAGTKNELLVVGSLVRQNKGVILVRGDALGANSIASAAASSSNIKINGTAPTLIGGGGAAGTTTISIAPWLIGGTTIADNGSTFVTYTAANGLRPLDTATEFATAFGGNATDNVRLTAVTDTAIVGDATVNSLILTGQGGSISGTGTLTVSSGAILMTRTTGASSSIGVNLDFGEAEGVIGYIRGDVVSGAIAGSGGLTVYGNRSDESLTFTNGASTYTGDTTILAAAIVSSGFLPSGTRTGNVYVYGALQLSTSGYHGTINGLFGNGSLTYGNSVASTLSIGDNNVTSTFDGTFTTNSNLTVTKIGTGTLTLNATNAISGHVVVSGGVLILNGTVGTADVKVNAGTLGGSGTIAGLVTTSGLSSVISPGNSPGTLTLSGGLNALNGATFDFELGTVSDQLNLQSGVFTGSSFAGGLVYNFSNAGGLAAGNAYTLVTFGSSTNLDYTDFAVNLTPAGYVLDTTYGVNGFLISGNALQVRFSAVPEPSAGLVLLAGSAVFMICRRRVRS